MPANGRRDLIRRLKVKLTYIRSCAFKKRKALQVMKKCETYFEDKNYVLRVYIAHTGLYSTHRSNVEFVTLYKVAHEKLVHLQFCKCPCDILSGVCILRRVFEQLVNSRALTISPPPPPPSLYIFSTFGQY